MVGGKLAQAFVAAGAAAAAARDGFAIGTAIDQWLGLSDKIANAIVPMEKFDDCAIKARESIRKLGAERLQALGIAVLALEPRSHGDVQRVIDTLGQVLGLPPNHARQLWQQIETSLVQAAQSLAPALRGRSVYVEVSPAPHAASEASFIGQTLARLGQVNIVPGRLGPFPQIQPEFVVQAQPDLIMVGDSSRHDMLKRPGWSRLKALQRGRVCAFEPHESEVLVRPGPRLAEAAQLMVRCLQRVGGLP
jgi:iron complex transport system substrate-binding protein